MSPIGLFVFLSITQFAGFIVSAFTSMVFLGEDEPLIGFSIAAAAIGLLVGFCMTLIQVGRLLS